MAIVTRTESAWKFGKLFLNYMDESGPTGELIYVVRDADGKPIKDQEITLYATTAIIAEIVNRPPIPGLSMAENVVYRCDQAMTKYGNLPGEVLSVAGAPVAAPEAPASPAPEAPAVDPVPAPVAPVEVVPEAPAAPAEPAPAEPAPAAPAEPAPEAPAP